MRITKYLYVSILDSGGDAFTILGVDDFITAAEERIEREKAKRGEPQPGEAYRIVEARQEVEKRTIRKVGAVRDRVPVFRLCVELTAEGWRLKKGIINKL